MSSIARHCLVNTLSILALAISGHAFGQAWPKLSWSSSGIGHTGTLPLYTGPTTITRDGEVIQNVRIDTALLIEADNVTIRNVQFRSCSSGRLLDDGNDGSSHEANRGVLVENSTFEGSTNAQIFMRGGWTVRRNKFRDSAGDTLKITGGNGQPILIEGNYFEGMGHNANGGVHSDGFQINKSDGGVVTIRGNTFNMPAEPFNSVVPGGCNAAAGGTSTILGRVIYFGSAIRLGRHRGHRIQPHQRQSVRDQQLERCSGKPDHLPLQRHWARLEECPLVRRSHQVRQRLGGDRGCPFGQHQLG